ncbi:carboxylate-amine ligase [Pseudomonas sp. UM16]|uniref:carboxylate-amine ligase n=1 Tax=Pseudomonas sp. UM16 TaxID=3158962 RepID=UPI003990145D
MNAPCDFGIEEEYLLVNLASGTVLATPSMAVNRLCREVMGRYFAEEMFRSQIEIASPVFANLHQAQAFFSESRERLNRALAQEGVGLYGAASHPSVRWQAQHQRSGEHYKHVFEDVQHVARCSVLSGLHVHVGVPASCDRMQLINRVLPWIPLLLVLSGSSPFWGSQATGYMSYRRVICAQWPHMGLPEQLADWSAYQRYRALLQRTGALPEAADLWWVIRPSRRFPTVELRICDACPRLEDALCIAGLFRCLVESFRVDHYQPAILSREQRWVLQENYWRALRYGRHGQFIGQHQQQPVDALAWLGQLQGQLNCATLDSERALRHARRILRDGNSADRQLRCYAQAMRSAVGNRQALRAVVDHVMEETRGTRYQSSEAVHGLA